MPLFARLDGLLHRLLSARPTPYVYALVPIVVACGRVAGETMLYSLKGYTPFDTPALQVSLHSVLDNLVFYLVVQVAMTGALSLASGRRPEEVAGPVAAGMFAAWLPPVLDSFLPSPASFGPPRYTYMWWIEWDLAAPYSFLGETVTLWLVIAAAGLFVGWISRSWTRGLAGALAAYVVILLVAWGWPELSRSMASLFGERRTQFYLSPLANRLHHVFGILFFFALQHVFRARSLLPTLARSNHTLLWGLISATAARMAGRSWGDAFVAALVIVLTVQLATIANDYFDREEDAGAGGTARPIDRYDAVIAFYLQGLLLFWTAVHHPSGLFALLGLVALVAAYHLPDLRLKRWASASYPLEGMAAGTCVLFGAMGGGGGAWLPVVMLLAVGGFTLGSMFKDYKDIDQDQAADIGTVYTRQLALGRSLREVHTFVRVCLLVELLTVPAMLLALGIPAWHAAPLVVLAVLAAWVLLNRRDRTVAVESTLWALCVYFAVLALIVPRLAA